MTNRCNCTENIDIIMLTEVQWPVGDARIPITFIEQSFWPSIITSLGLHVADIAAALCHES